MAFIFLLTKETTNQTMNITTSNDALFKGATVRFDDTLNLNVGNNLEVASVQNTASSSNHGFNISGGFGLGNDKEHTSNNPDKIAQKSEQEKMNQTIGVRTGDGTIASVNGNIGASNGRSYDTKTVLTSLTGNSVNVTTGANTKISGAVIAATDNQGYDTKNLNLSTGTLTTENITDTHYNSATGFSVGANVGLAPKVTNPQPDSKTDNASKTKLNSERMTFNTSTDTSVGKTLATLGQGTVIIGDTANSSDITNLNRDVTKSDKELYSSSTGTKVDATLDNRLLTSEGRAQIKQEYKDMDKNMNAIAKTLPDSKSDHPVEAIAGTVLDTLATVTGGILPTAENHGGLLANIPIITGNNDSNFEVTGDLSSTRVYLNGQSNTLPDAIQGGNNLIGDVPHQNWYNPTHGFIGDTLESATDLLFNSLGMQTGISQQIDVLQNNGTVWKIYMHSQGNLIAKKGANKNNTYYSYGSPLLSSTVEEVFDTKANKNEGDFVANPQNIFLPNAWFEPGHATKNYGAAKENKERFLKEKVEQ